MTNPTYSALTEGGFTLLELTVAITLFAMVAVLAAGGIRFGVAAWESSADLGETTVEDRATQKFLGRLIAQARPIRVRDGTREPPVYFVGEPDSLLFIAPLPAQLAPVGDHLVSMTVDPRDEGDVLALRWLRVDDRFPRMPAGLPAEFLSTDVEALSFRYFGPDSESGALVWRNDWLGRPDLPRLVEVTVQRSDAASNAWAPVVARLEAAWQP